MNVDPVLETSGTDQPSSSPSPSSATRVRDLPKEVGAMLVSVGVLGVVLPGVLGAPALVAGGLVLWPGTFGKVEDWFRRRYPDSYENGMRQINRYLDDMERRFPAADHAS